MIVYVEICDSQADAPSGRVSLEDAPTVADVWSRLAAGPSARQGRNQPAGLVILVNGRLAAWHTALHDGDVVRFVAAPGGG